ALCEECIVERTRKRSCTQTTHHVHIRWQRRCVAGHRWLRRDAIGYLNTLTYISTHVLRTINRGRLRSIAGNVEGAYNACARALAITVTEIDPVVYPSG